VEELLDPDRGTVTLAYQLSLGTWLVPHLVEGFRRRRPAVRFVLEQARDELVSAVLGRGRVDLEITTLRSTSSDVTWHRLTSEPLCVAAPVGHRIADADRVWLHDVAREPFVSLRATSLLRQQVTELCEQAGFRPTVAFEADDMPTVRAFVAAGLGVAIVPAARVGTAEAAGTVLRHVPIADPGAVREVGLAHSTERRLLPAAEDFRGYVLERASTADLPDVA
jgi:DNA-binding transcriptional LysR family regulator